MLVPIRSTEILEGIRSTASTLKDALMHTAGKVITTSLEVVQHGVELSGQALDALRGALFEVVSILVGQTSPSPRLNDV